MKKNNKFQTNVFVFDVFFLCSVTFCSHAQQLWKLMFVENVVTCVDPSPMSIQAAKYIVSLEKMKRKIERKKIQTFALHALKVCSCFRSLISQSMFSDFIRPILFYFTRFSVQSHNNKKTTKNT